MKKIHTDRIRWFFDGRKTIIGKWLIFAGALSFPVRWIFPYALDVAVVLMAIGFALMFYGMYNRYSKTWYETDAQGKVKMRACKIEPPTMGSAGGGIEI